MNRTGDMILSIGFFALFGLFGSFNYETIFSLAPHSNEIAITIISLLLIGGSLAKSAQIPLHSWLPGSMEAPTPVSALLHAANKKIKNFWQLLNFVILISLYNIQFILCNPLIYLLINNKLLQVLRDICKICKVIKERNFFYSFFNYHTTIKKN
jgi:formate hydrogenlyase subunit 3/multisubunit Na+/H+ antiporter MnhD subunit